MRLLWYGPGSASASAFALTVGDEQYDACAKDAPPDPAAPPAAVVAECDASGTDGEGRAANSAALASVSLGTTSAGVDGQGNPLVSALTLTAMTNGNAFGAANANGQTANATSLAACSAAFVLSAPAGTPITALLLEVAALDPAATGAPIVIEDGAGRALATLDAPPGAFERSSRQGWTDRTFKSRKGALRALTLEGSTITAKGLARGISARKVAQPLAVRILLDTTAPPTARCTEAVFAGPAGVNPVCTARRGRLVCRMAKPRASRRR